MNRRSSTPPRECQPLQACPSAGSEAAQHASGRAVARTKRIAGCDKWQGRLSGTRLGSAVSLAPPKRQSQSGLRIFPTMFPFGYTGATRDEEAPVQQELEIDNLVDALIEREGG